MNDSSGHNAAVAEFLKRLEVVPWFSQLGKPGPEVVEVETISTWEEWPGPEEWNVAELSERLQELYDTVFSDAADEEAAPISLRDAIRVIVFRRATHAVPYDPNEDPWHGPTAAVRQAAWTAEYIGMCLQLGRPVPAEIQSQWEWFERGHWPCGYAPLLDKPGRLLIF